MLWQLILLLTICGIIWDLWYRWKVNRILGNIPQLKYTNYPLIGHAYTFFGNNEAIMTAFQMLGNASIECGGIMRYWFGNRMYLVVAEPEITEFFLKNCLTKDDVMNVVRHLTANGSIFAPVNIWRPRRKLLAVAFNLKVLKQFTEVFSRQSRVLVRRLAAAPPGPLSVWNYLTTYTMDAIFETNLGVRIEAQKNPSQPFLQDFEHCSQLLGFRICKIYLKPDCIYRLLPQKALMDKLTNNIYTFIDNIIGLKRRERLEEREQQTGVDPEQAQTPKKIQTFLELLEMSESFSDIELREECLVMAIAGTDTSAVAACFTVLMLARHPGVQEKIHAELQEVFGESDRAVTFEDLLRLKYTEAVVKESLRLYPPVPVIVRKVEEDIVLPNGTKLFPGIGILVNIWALHRNPRYWGPDADEFRPERFLDQLTPAFMPFSCGPRNCLGSTYAMMSLKTSMANLLRTYRFVEPALNSPGKPIRVKFDIMMKDVDNFIVQIEKRRQH